jgi:hypothetical protein
MESEKPLDASSYNAWLSKNAGNGTPVSLGNGLAPLPVYYNAPGTNGGASGPGVLGSNNLPVGLNTMTPAPLATPIAVSPAGTTATPKPVPVT